MNDLQAEAQIATRKKGKYIGSANINILGYIMCFTVLQLFMQI